MAEGTDTGATTNTDANAGNGNGGSGTDAGNAGGQDKTFTQADLDRIVGERVARERAKFGDYDDLKSKAGQFDQLAESQKTEQQKLQDRATGAEQRATSAEAKALRYDVAAEKGLPLKWASRLSGATKEELLADADELLKELKPGDGDSTNFDGGARTGGDPPKGMNALIRQAAGRTS